MTRPARPELSVEQELWSANPTLVAYDECGRGAIAGPVAVGVVLLRPGCAAIPEGLQDSKQLSAARRRAVLDETRTWVHGWAVGYSSATEIEKYGIMRALRTAAGRATSQLGVDPGVVLVDGPYDWVTRPAAIPGEPAVTAAAVRCVVRGDARCGSLAAASVIAKEHRDAMMARLSEEHPGYGWHRNRGYGSREHRAALEVLGPSPEHRLSWCVKPGR